MVKVMIKVRVKMVKILIENSRLIWQQSFVVIELLWEVFGLYYIFLYFVTDIGLSYIIEIRVKELERIKRQIEIFKEELMRVGIFTDTYFPQVSGVATSVRVLKEELERLGHTVIIFTTTDPNATMPEWNIVRLGSIPLFSFKERRIAVQGFIEAYKVS